MLGSSMGEKMPAFTPALFPTGGTGHSGRGGGEAGESKKRRAVDAVGVGREGGPWGNPGGTDRRRDDRAGREPEGRVGPASWRRPHLDSHVMTFCHAPVLSQSLLETVRHGTLDTIFLKTDLGREEGVFQPMFTGLLSG